MADLIRPSTLVEAVVIADEALHKRLVDRQQLERYSGARLRRVLGLANAASESPMETRLRLILVLAGLPVPRVQESLYADGILLGRVDLYYPDARLAIEYNGQTHRSTLVEDNRRQNRLINAGFRLLVRSALDSARRRLN